MNPENQVPYTQGQNNSNMYRQPSNRPYFQIASLIFGILSMVTMCTGFLPLPCGALGILFSILAARRAKRWPTIVTVGTILSGVGMSIALFIVSFSLLMMPSMLRDPQYREYLNNMSRQMYGESFDEMMKEGYGIDLDDYFSTNQD